MELVAGTPHPTSLHCLGPSDHQAFLRAHAHLGRATPRTYLKGARAAQEAGPWGMGFKGPQATAPWRGLMGCGLSLPVACGLRWSDLDLEGGWAQTALRLRSLLWGRPREQSLEGT